MKFSPCSATCGEGYKTRSRLLIRFPDTTGNTDCRVNENGLQTEMEPCVLPPCTPTNNLVYTWNVEDWSQCRVLSKLSHNSQHSSTTLNPCGHGYQNRSVFCGDGNNQAVAEQFCIDSSSQQNSKPSSHQACVVPCSDRCIVSDWSEFSTCQNGNVTRTREISINGSSNWREICPELVAIATLETAPCSTVNYNHYGWTPTSLFGKCIFESSNNATCGNGFKYRAYSCVDIQNTRLVSEEFCMGKTHDGTQDTCAIPCERDCEVSEWGAWRDCSVTCGLGHKTRTRTVRRAMEGGRECGPLKETTVCAGIPCEFPEYRAGSYGPCVLENTSGICGEGTQTREPLCVVNGVTQSDNSSCAHLQVVFATERSCNLPCPGECVMSAWGPWTKCPEDCPTSTCQQSRRRRILRPGANCKQTTAFRTCRQVSNVFEWSVQPWTDCIIPPRGNADYCGNGLQHRIVQCINVALNKTVLESNCENSGSKPTANQTCSLPCPVDCKVGRFSSWSKCPNVCATSLFQTRQRNILVHPSNGGQACPPLEERRPCNASNCDSYVVEPHASPCSAEYTNASTCGSVETAKTMSCRKNNRFVNLGECVVAMQSEARITGSEYLRSPVEYCDLPCRTEPNCTYTDWSEWSECTHLCHQSASQKFTFRSRKLLKSLERYRNECLKHQFEELPCGMEPDVNASDVIPGNVSAPCIEFNWQTAEWDRDGSRTIWCQSGTGTQVSESGCIDTIRPVAQQGTCRSECDDDLRFCNQTSGDCECSTLYEQVGSVCLPTRGCFVNSHCLYPNSVCNGATLSCACAEGLELMDGICVTRQPTTLPTDTTSTTTVNASSPTDQVTSPTDLVTSPTDHVTSPTDQETSFTPEPDGLGVLPIALISALPLVVVIGALLILIIITYRCRNHLEKKHIEERDQKLRSISISHPAPPSLTTEAVQGMRRGADSASSGFVDDREIENYVFKHGTPGRMLGGLPEIDIDEAAFPGENDYATIPRQLPIGYTIPPVPHPTSSGPMQRYVEEDERAMRERAVYMDEYPGVPITDVSSLAPSSVQMHSPFALRRHNPLQDQGGMMTDGDELTFSSTASTPHIPQRYQHRPSSLPHDPPTHQPSSSRHHRPYSPNYNSPPHQPGSPRSFFPDYDIPPHEPPSPRQPPQDRSYGSYHYPPYSQPSTPHYPLPSHYHTRHYSERSQSPTPLGYPGPSHSYPSSRLGYHHTKDERLTAGMEGPLVRAVAQMAGSTGRASPSAAGVGSRNSSRRSSGRRVRYRHPGNQGPYPGNPGPYPGNWGQYPSNHGAYPSNHGRYPGDISMRPSNTSSSTHSPYLNARNSHIHEGGTSTLPRHSSHGYSHQYYRDHHHQEEADYDEPPPTGEGTPYSHYDTPRREGSFHLHHSTPTPYSNTFVPQALAAPRDEADTNLQQPGSPYLSGRSPANPSPLILNSFSCSEERRVAQSLSSCPPSSYTGSPPNSPFRRNAPHQPDVYSDAYVEEHQHVPVLPPSGSSHQSEHYRLGRQPSIPRRKREGPEDHYARPRANQHSSEGSESEQTPNTSAASMDESINDSENHSRSTDPPMEMPSALEGDRPTVTFGLQGAGRNNQKPREGFLSQPTVTTFK